uniref:Uncharacterized protein n=2 Tax=viral metagenome TaxID=1070528 RepID=A0A6M3ILL4_9ZZZZ
MARILLADRNEGREQIMSESAPTYEDMHAALLALLTARKESSEQFRRVSYGSAVQSVFDRIEEGES